MTNVEYTVKIQFVALKKQTDVWILLCFNFLEILSYLFIFHLLSHPLQKTVMQLVNSYNCESKWIIPTILKLTACMFQYQLYGVLEFNKEFLWSLQYRNRL